MDIEGFWERVNTLIKIRKTTQRAISKDCGFKERRIETLVSRKLAPDVAEAFLIAKYFDVSIEFLLTGEDDLTEAERELLQVFKGLNEQGKLVALSAVKALSSAFLAGYASAHSDGFKTNPRPEKENKG